MWGIFKLNLRCYKGISHRVTWKETILGSENVEGLRGKDTVRQERQTWLDQGGQK